MTEEPTPPQTNTPSPSSPPPVIPGQPETLRSPSQAGNYGSVQKASLGPDPDYTPMEQEGFSNILNHLLKKPLSVIYEVNQGNNKPLKALIIISLASLTIFGLVLGMFSSGDQLWAAPLKVIGGIFFSALICLPSLYIFGALGGMDAKIQHVVGVMLTFLAITSLLLVGFAPVVWLFSTSSNSLVFFGFLSLGIWLVCLIFGLRVISRSSRSMGGGKGGHLNIWAIIFIMVTLQMTTTLRPIIGTSEHFLNFEEKRFFLRYWFEVMNDESSESDKYVDPYESSNDERKTDSEKPTRGRSSQ
ncbi:hypothetical protein HW115_15680 [Verrucomicrobiaceae bacterium N1E253]|uniref:Uncharacterized protein n=1 Tax=Oceaniferula marina TaxID=2748318 RepID=A0A851GHQ9_9BACT|nr:Yip1 family protein [Oceaniferula marina]NWK57063.1 hypothetical protein [Oceaniferula marina]